VSKRRIDGFRSNASLGQMDRANFRFGCNKSNFENPYNHLLMHTYSLNAHKQNSISLEKIRLHPINRIPAVQ
jgi:hypothetical protein